MHSFRLPEIPYYLDYVSWIVLLVAGIIILRKAKQNKDQKRGCGVALFSLLYIGSISYFFFPLVFGLLHAFYGIIFYPKYDVVVIDSVQKYSHRGDSGRDIYLSYPVLEFEDENGKIIHVESNEGTTEEISLKTESTILYKNKTIIQYSFWSVLVFVGLLLIAVLLGHALVFAFYYGIGRDPTNLKETGILIGLFVYMPLAILIIVTLLSYSIYTHFSGV